MPPALSDLWVREMTQQGQHDPVVGCQGLHWAMSGRTRVGNRPRGMGGRGREDGMKKGFSGKRVIGWGFKHHIAASESVSNVQAVTIGHSLHKKAPVCCRV